MVFNIVNVAIEKLLTFSEDTHISSVLPQTLQTAVQEHEHVTAAGSKPVEKRSHTIQQYHWMNLPPLGPTQQESSLNDTPVLSPSPQWVYPYPYSLYGPAQPVATGNRSSTASGAPAPIVKQLPRQQQTLSAQSSHQQG